MWMFLCRSAAGVLVVRQQRYWCIQYCVTDRTRFVCDEWLCQKSWRLCCSIHIDTMPAASVTRWWVLSPFVSTPFNLGHRIVGVAGDGQIRPGPRISHWVSREFINTHNIPVDLSLWDLGGVKLLFPVDRNAVVAKLPVGLVSSLQRPWSIIV